MGEGEGRVGEIRGGKIYQAGSTNVLGRFCPAFTAVDGLEEQMVKQVGPKQCTNLPPFRASTYVRTSMYYVPGSTLTSPFKGRASSLFSPSSVETRRLASRPPGYEIPWKKRGKTNRSIPIYLQVYPGIRVPGIYIYIYISGMYIYQVYIFKCSCSSCCAWSGGKPNAKDIPASFFLSHCLLFISVQKLYITGSQQCEPPPAKNSQARKPRPLTCRLLIRILEIMPTATRTLRRILCKGLLCVLRSRLLLASW